MKTEIKYGLLCGTIITAYSAITLFMAGDISTLSPAQFKSFESTGYLRYMILIFMIYLAIRETVKKIKAGASFSSLLKTGIIVALIASLMVGATQAVFILGIPGFFQAYTLQYIEQLRLAGQTEAEIKLALETMSSQSIMQSSWGNGLFYFLLTAFIGCIASLSFAMIMRSRPAF